MMMEDGDAQLRALSRPQDLRRPQQLRLVHAPALVSPRAHRVQTDREDFRRPGDRRLEADLRERDATRGGNGRPRPGHRAIAVLEQREHRVRHGSGKIRDLVASDALPSEQPVIHLRYCASFEDPRNLRGRALAGDASPEVTDLGR